MKRLLYSECATDDLKGILDFIAHDKPIAAKAFVDGIIDTCRLIAKTPKLGCAAKIWRQHCACLRIEVMGFIIAISQPK